MIILRLHDQNTPDYFLGVDKDWIECKDRDIYWRKHREYYKSEKVEFDNIEVRKILIHTLILPSVSHTAHKFHVNVLFFFYIVWCIANEALYF
jgi:hypothetical protein